MTVVSLALALALGAFDELPSDATWLEACRAKLGPLEKPLPKGSTRPMSCRALAPADAGIVTEVRPTVGPVWLDDGHLRPFEVRVRGVERVLKDRPDGAVKVDCEVFSGQGALVGRFPGYVKGDAFQPLEVYRSQSTLEHFEAAAKEGGPLAVQCAVVWSETHDLPGERIFLTREARSTHSLPVNAALRLPKTRLETLKWSADAKQQSLEVTLTRELPPGAPAERDVSCSWRSELSPEHVGKFELPWRGGEWHASAGEKAHRFTVERGPNVASPRKEVRCTVSDGAKYAVEPLVEVVQMVPTSKDVGRPAVKQVQVLGASEGRRTKGAATCSRCDQPMMGEVRAIRRFEVQTRLDGFTAPIAYGVQCESPLGVFEGRGVLSPGDGGTSQVVSLSAGAAVDPSMNGRDLMDHSPAPDAGVPDAGPTPMMCLVRVIPPYLQSEPRPVVVPWGPWLEPSMLGGANP